MILLVLFAALSAGTTTSTDEQATVARHVESVQIQTVAAPVDRNYASSHYEFVVHEPSDASRAQTRPQVMNELKQAKADGTYNAMHQEFDEQYLRTAVAREGTGKATGLAHADGKAVPR